MSDKLSFAFLIRLSIYAFLLFFFPNKCSQYVAIRCNLCVL